MKKSYVIKTNVDRSILNLIKKYIWEDIEPKKSFIKTCEYWNKMQGVECDLNLNEIKAFYKKYIKNLQEINNFKSFIKEIRSQNCPSPRSFKKLMENEGIEEFKNEKELHAFILSVLIPIVNNI